MSPEIRPELAAQPDLTAWQQRYIEHRTGRIASESLSDGFALLKAKSEALADEFLPLLDALHLGSYTKVHGRNGGYDMRNIVGNALVKALREEELPDGLTVGAYVERELYAMDVDGRDPETYDAVLGFFKKHEQVGTFPPPRPSLEMPAELTSWQEAYLADPSSGIASESLASGVRLLGEKSPAMAREFQPILDRLHLGAYTQVPERNGGYDMRNVVGTALTRALEGEVSPEGLSASAYTEKWLADMTVQGHDPKTFDAVVGFFKKHERSGFFPSAKVEPDLKLAPEPPPNLTAWQQRYLANKQSGIASESLSEGLGLMQTASSALAREFLPILDALHLGAYTRVQGRNGGYDMRELVGNALKKVFQGGAATGEDSPAASVEKELYLMDVDGRDPKTYEAVVGFFKKHEQGGSFAAAKAGRVASLQSGLDAYGAQGRSGHPRNYGTLTDTAESNRSPAFAATTPQGHHQRHRPGGPRAGF